MFDPLQIVQTETQASAVIHLVVPRAEIVRVMAPAMQELVATLQAQGIPPAGPCYSWHPQRPSEVFDFEVGFPVASALISTGRVRMSRLPAARVARTVYRGGYDGLAMAWGAFIGQVEAAGLRPGSGLWECYLSGPESGTDSSSWCTELNLPLA